MSVFENYARYYDLLYRDKPYKQEADYICELILKHAPTAKVLVELGCGTGIHAEHLAYAEMEVHGVDLSYWMLEQAETRREILPEMVAGRLHFSHGDVRDVRLGLKADAVISLFHVMSYQSENTDLLAMFETAHKHLKRGGVFIFDVWYGPAVLSDQPAVRAKVLEDDTIKISRIAQPLMYPNRNLVDVQYRIIVCDKYTGGYSEANETHRMRYLFSPEIESFAAQTGFTVIDSHEWVSGRKLGFDTWGACFVCRV